MFTSLEYIKVNSADYVEKYSNKFNRLIKQSDKDRSFKIDLIMAEIRDKNIFIIQGDEKFEKEVYNDIKSLLQVKPGRLLIKELIKLVSQIPDSSSIPIKSGNKYFHHQNGTIEINCDGKTDNSYNALCGTNRVTCIRPREITLAHELIHELDDRIEHLQIMVGEYARCKSMQRDPSYDVLKGIKLLPIPKFEGYTIEGFEGALIFNKLDNAKEQSAILGVNIPNFIKNENKLHKLDILSENVFLCAFNYLPRIDHKQAETNIEESIQLNHEHLSSYYVWMRDQLEQRNERVKKEFGYMDVSCK